MEMVPIYKILVVDAPTEYATAKWKKDNTGWMCLEAANLLEWMVGMGADEAKAAMDKLGYKRFWMDINPTTQLS